MATGTQSDAAQPLLYNIYKLGKWEYKPDNREPYEVRRSVRLSDLSRSAADSAPSSPAVPQRPHAAGPNRKTTPGSHVPAPVLEIESAHIENDGGTTT